MRKLTRGNFKAWETWGVRTVSHPLNFNENFRNFADPRFIVNMDIYSRLIVSMHKAFEEIAPGTIISESKISTNKLSKPRSDSALILEIWPFTISTIFRIRAQGRLNSPATIGIEENEGSMAPILDAEIQHCAAVIAAAFLNPGKLN